jgi:hypothetical protein
LRWQPPFGPQRLWIFVAAAVLLLAVGPGGALASGAPTGSTGSAGADAPAGDFSLNLYKRGDFVSQYTVYWCVGASMQMMLAISDVSDDMTRSAQRRYMLAARTNGPSQRQIDHGLTDEAGDLRGAGSAGWARGLVELGAGRYEQRAFDNYSSAIRAVAYAVRKTNRPVGLIVWRGAHAWVVSGITASSDPLVDPDFRVTGVYVQDPWYPRVSSIWGRGKRPNSYLSVRSLRSAFLPRRAGRWHAELAGKFVVVLPVDSIWRAPQLRRAV